MKQFASAQPARPTPIFLRWGKFLLANWFECAMVFLLAQFLANGTVQVNVQPVEQLKTSVSGVTAGVLGASSGSSPAGAAQPVANIHSEAAANYRNLSFILNPGLAESKQVPEWIVEEKLEKCRKYVEDHAEWALEEMQRYGIPASITLAQGLLESDAGESLLATQSNNHFGIKCRRQCRGCTCRNYADDDLYDMFRVFSSVHESYRAHSELLVNSPRYAALFDLEITDYRGWARGLQNAGYATDPRYAAKLIRIIEALELFLFDRAATPLP